MNRQELIERLKSEQASLQALGLKRLSLFGSAARGEATPLSDIDLAVTLDDAKGIDLFRFAAISDRLSLLLDANVDLVVEPARSARLQDQIDRDRQRVY